MNSALPQESLTPLRGLGIIALLHVAFALLTWAFAAAAGSPFVLWFSDTPLLLGAVLTLLLLMGIVWDGTLVSLGLVTETLWKRIRNGRAPPLSVEKLHEKRFFTCGPGPIVLLLATSLAILGTSNITLLNLELLGSTTRWRDPLLWEIEGALLQRIAGISIDTASWDRLYHSAWGIELIAAFALVVIGRGSRIVLRYCVTMILLFYLGRLLGVLNPVMGPGFFRPDVFAYLEGSVTAEAMRVVAQVMASRPEDALHSGGILLGGVSAMPSLHVAMVAVTAYWLSRAARWTLFFTVPWVLLVWTSTVVLGWHYVVDGAGGLALAAVSVVLAVRLLNIADGPA